VFEQALPLLLAAEKLLRGRRLGGYVDVSTGFEALEQVSSAVQWEIFREAGPAVDGNTSVRLVDGQPMNCDQYWARRGWDGDPTI
jgi:hypothetical protein